jgi:hypothetical protein
MSAMHTRGQKRTLKQSGGGRGMRISKKNRKEIKDKGQWSCCSSFVNHTP